MSFFWHASEILAATGAHVMHSGQANQLRRILTDSRMLKQGDVFVALRGQRFDGHDFLSEALGKGVGGVVVEGWPTGEQAGCFVFKVPDTLKALGDLAQHYRKNFSIPVVAVTGSNGKTSTKEMIAAMMRQRHRAHMNDGNLNNLVGLPCTLLAMPLDAQMCVVEMGMNHQGEIARLTEIADPTLGVITNVGPAHLEGVGDLAGVAGAKSELFRHMGQTAVSVVNCDDPWIAPMPVKDKKITFGQDPACDVALVSSDVSSERVKIILTLAGEHLQVVLRSAASYQAKNALAAAAVGYALGFAGDEIRCGLEQYRPVAHRGQVYRAADGMVLVDDSYNANPASMQAALEDFVVRYAGACHKVFLMGEMLELGRQATSYHEQMAGLASRLGFTTLVAVGPTAARALTAFELAEGVAHKKAAAFATVGELIKEIDSWVGVGDAILVKGSRGAEMDRATLALTRAFQLTGEH